jgi:hypothetical protein
MAELKTKKNDASVKSFLAGVQNEQRREDSLELLALMKKITRKQPKMWGTSIVGFGSHHYRHASGQEGDWPLTGFSPRKQALTLHVMTGFREHGALMKRLGKYETGKACLYLKKLDDVDREILAELIRRSVEAQAAGR